MFNGWVMNGDVPVGKVVNDVVEIVNSDLIPLAFKKCSHLPTWLETRAIDAHRTHSRLLKKVLRLAERDDASTVLAVHSATLTDRYWVKGFDEQLTYEDVRFQQNDFDRLALYGDMSCFMDVGKRYSPLTPELTNTGSFEKCWRLENREWWMHKQGSVEERFSEMFQTLLGRKLGFAMAEYVLDDDVIKSRDFTDGARVNFEPAWALIGVHYEDYDLNYKAFLEISPLCAKQYLDILYLDAVCFNPDRHEHNYGLLRDISTGEVLSLAPSFDHNLSLISRGYLDPKRGKDMLIADFCELLSMHNIHYVPPVFTVQDVDEIIQQIGLPVKGEIVKEFVLNGQSVLASSKPSLENLIGNAKMQTPAGQPEGDTKASQEKRRTKNEER